MCYREINIFVNIKILLFNKIPSFHQEYQNSTVLLIVNLKCYILYM